MKIHTLLCALLALSCPMQGQTANGEALKSYFSTCLQGDHTRHTSDMPMAWDDVEECRTAVWNAWCEANLAYEEDRLPALRPLTNADTLLWPLPAHLEPNAVMPYYFGTKGDKPAEGWPLYLYIHGSGPKTMLQSYPTNPQTSPYQHPGAHARHWQTHHANPDPHPHDRK